MYKVEVKNNCDSFKLMEQGSLRWFFGDKGKLICDKFVSFRLRFPSLLKERTLKELSGFLYHCPDLFLEQRSPSFLIALFLRCCRIRQALENNKEQKCTLDLIKIYPSRCGVIIGQYVEENGQMLHEKTICKGVRKYISAVVPLSPYFCYRHDTIMLHYLEFNKIRGGLFSKAECLKLRAELGLTFLKELESTAPAFYLLGNDEEIFKNIRHLSQELNSSCDLVQVMITPLEYTVETVTFLVIAVRFITEETQTLIALSQNLPTFMQFMLESIFSIEEPKKQHTKEAGVFSLTVNHAQISAGRRSMHLRAARILVAKALECMFGSFRDYNGGLFIKENEQLAAIRHAVEIKGPIPDFFEDLFDNIHPAFMKALLTQEAGIALTELFNRAMQGSDPLICLQEKQFGFVLLKTREKHFKISLPCKLIVCFPQLGHTVLEVQDEIYLCFFHSTVKAELLLKAVKKLLAEQETGRMRRPQNKLRLNFQGADPPSLNPRLAFDIHSHILSNLLFEGVTRRHSAGHVVCAAAERIECAQDRLSYHFYLRKSWWSNGQEVTAYDFERGWKKALMQSIPGRPQRNLLPIKNIMQVKEGKAPVQELGIRALGARELMMTLDSPCPYLLSLLASPSFFPQWSDDEEPIVFNGPFFLSDWVRGKRIELLPNPFYRDQSPLRPGSIEISMIRDPYAAYAQFQQGLIDFIGDPISPLPPDLLFQPEIQQRLLLKPLNRVFWVHCNCISPPLNCADLRRALNYALDRRAIVEKVFPYQTPHLSLLPPQYATLSLEDNPKLAEAYLEKSLAELGLSRRELQLTLSHSDLSFDRQLAEELKIQWEELLGIRLELRELSWSAFSTTLERGDFQLAGLFRRDVAHHVLSYLEFFTNDPDNPYRIENGEYDRLLQAFYAHPEDQGIVKKLEKLLTDESPVIPLVNQNALALVADRLTGMCWDMNGCLNFDEVVINE